MVSSISRKLKRVISMTSIVRVVKTCRQCGKKLNCMWPGIFRMPPTALHVSNIIFALANSTLMTLTISGSLKEGTVVSVLLIVSLRALGIIVLTNS